MARKSLLTLGKERLAAMSDCPLDIFNKIEPEEDLFNKIARADNGDAAALCELCELLAELYLPDDEPNAALLHYARIGLRHADKKCALIILDSICRHNLSFDLLSDALALLKDESIEEMRRLATVKCAIASALPDADINSLISELSDIDDERADYARIYLESRRLVYSGNDACEMTKKLGLSGIIPLPVYSGCAETAQSEPGNNSDACQRISYAISLIKMDEWQSFWLKIAYEYAGAYLAEDLSPFADKIIEVIEGRSEYPSKKLHLMALKKYALDAEKAEGDDGYLDLLEACRFDGYEGNPDNTEERDRLIVEAIYADCNDLREEQRKKTKLGSIITHPKNRYALSAIMSNHQKRGYKHIWETRLSIEIDSDMPPSIDIAKIVDRKNEVSRFGITLEREKKLSQVHCSGEITVNDKTSPFEIDLVLDISYVSSTKCERCEIKIKDCERDGKYLTMLCSISIY